MSHTVLIELSCLSGQGPAYLEALVPLLPDTRAFKGCELVETYSDQDNPDVIYLWEKWASRQDQEAYLAWRIETGTFNEMNRFMAADPRFIHLAPAD